MSTVIFIKQGNKILLGILILLMAMTRAWAFNSGSTGADGAFSPTADTAIALPANGILNYTTINIPAGVTVKITRNAANTPAYLLVQGDAVIDGVIDMSGVDSEVLSGGPAGSFAGGVPQTTTGGNGQGPGGSAGGNASFAANGGSYSTLGFPGRSGSASTNIAFIGAVYGSSSLQPLLGGSGGGATALTASDPGRRGGGGGGALLLAVSGTLTLNGNILINGGDGGDTTDGNTPASGGGSGGALRVIASTFSGGGHIDFSGGAAGNNTVNTNGGGTGYDGGAGGIGRARLEADSFNFVGTANPQFGYNSRYVASLRRQPPHPADQHCCRCDSTCNSYGKWRCDITYLDS